MLAQACILSLAEDCKQNLPLPVAKPSPRAWRQIIDDAQCSHPALAEELRTLAPADRETLFEALWPPFAPRFAGQRTPAIRVAREVLLVAFVAFVIVLVLLVAGTDAPLWSK